MATKVIMAEAAFRRLKTSVRMVDGSRSPYLRTCSRTRTGAYRLAKQGSIRCDSYQQAPRIGYSSFENFIIDSLVSRKATSRHFGE